ncbi:DNA primase [Haliea sp. E17]|uniref:DNA primase n=1 Tax=Haliea sp. E17 TaxID=3401576 RepID=UPI003AAFC134
MAGRIPQSFIDDLLERLDIVEVVDRRVKLKKTGKNYSARCPFHEEKTPSFSVSPDKQFYYCFGCGAGGNALGFVMDYENLGFPEAVESLAASLGLQVPREQGSQTPEAARREQQQKSLYGLLEQAADYYRQQLRQHPQKQRAVDYLKGRGLTGEIARAFDLGFAPPGWDNLLKALGQDEETSARLLQGGMLVENEQGRVYDRFRDRIIFPIRDQRGRVIAFGGRVLGDDKPKYLNSPETPIFHKGRELYGFYQALQANRKLERILVVEGYMDVIALAQHGISYAVATLGTATSSDHLQRIYRRCPEVIFCFDGDEAGRKAAFRALESALPALEDGRQARFLFLPEGEDPDSLVRSLGRESFEELLGTARPLEDFLFDAVGEGIDTHSLDGRARLARQALPYVRQLPEGVLRELMMQELARRTGLELASLMRLESAAPKPAEKAAPAPLTEDHPAPPAQQSPAEIPPRPRQRTAGQQYRVGGDGLAQGAIALILHKPAIAAGVDPDMLSVLDGEDSQLLRELIELVQRRPESNTGMLLGHWYGTGEGELLNRLAGQERLIPTEGIDSQFHDILDVLLRRIPHQSQLARQVDKLKGTNYADVSEIEKQRLRELLQEKRQRDAQRNRRET